MLNIKLYCFFFFNFTFLPIKTSVVSKSKLRLLRYRKIIRIYNLYKNITYCHWVLFMFFRLIQNKGFNMDHLFESEKLSYFSYFLYVADKYNKGCAFWFLQETQLFSLSQKLSFSLMRTGLLICSWFKILDSHASTILVNLFLWNTLYKSHIRGHFKFNPTNPPTS